MTEPTPDPRTEADEVMRATAQALSEADRRGLAGQTAIRASRATVKMLGAALVPGFDAGQEPETAAIMGNPVEYDDRLPDGEVAVVPRIIRPGVYDITFTQYLADPVAAGSLSSSGARMLLNKTPAHFRHHADHPEDRTSTGDMDFGSVAHDLVLGKGKGFVEVREDSWRKNVAKDARAAAEAAGMVALLSKDVEIVHKMADALRRHPLAASLLDPEYGQAEQCIVWRTAPVTGATPDGWAEREPVWCRAMIDFLRERQDDPSMPYVLPDYKTCESATTADVMKTAERYGYHQQGDFYLRAVRSVPGLILPGQPVRFAIIAQEKTPPFLVNVVTPDADAMKVARRRNDDALALYAQCRASGVWPGYGDAANVGSLPAWATRELRGDW